VCVCVCVRARVCLSFAVAAQLQSPTFLAVVVVSPHPSLPRESPRCLPSLHAPFSASRICFAVGSFTTGFSSASSVSASRAPVVTSHSFSVSSRESGRLHFIDSSSKLFPPEPRTDSIFETFSIDLRQKPNREALARSPCRLASCSLKNSFYLSGCSSFFFSGSSGSS
jgi:hypothetical protein